MGIKVLVVDDSSFFRRRVSEMINQDVALEVIGTAVNGREAVEMAVSLRPQVITMDIEMPIMDGISAVKAIMQATPTPILMFSSLTHAGASATLDALEAGALDFLPKRFEDIATNKDIAITLLQQKIKLLGRRRLLGLSPAHLARTLTRDNTPIRTKPLLASEDNKQPASSMRTAEISKELPLASNVGRVTCASGKQYKLVIIGTSTGGPVALQKVLTQFPAHYPYPILLIQHMPAAFTPAFASRLNNLCKISVKQAENEELLRAGCAYLAPGGMQMMLERGGRFGRIKILVGKQELNYKPSVDISFASASKVIADKTLAVVLTGMGADGREGARMLKNTGATIWAQNEASCVVYGMPQAVVKAGLATKILALEDIADAILCETGMR
ncbi:protein-glutamate methylesterase/protein-glutamine glutaminase [Shewanella surugensis]|uniref:Protein-glutamate methylesterase/protein-glutamine glutaminase n=1 Tax=Shewanella surugensis TaxID=212020 RepID=A0ABT0L848_9GAMM|nr:chemotaxis response regulator protein-glutamate methylesterase [Shewanella surugensis]MCL1123862.1 chemotaxis response regulator protein-glutamate methylesterase [Shewanella surugensis]